MATIEKTAAGTYFRYDLGAGERLDVYFPNHPSNASYATPGLVCGTWYGKNGSFSAMNNLAHHGHGPGLEKELSIDKPGIAANWFMSQQFRFTQAIAQDCPEIAQERRDEQERRAAYRKRQAALKGGLVRQGNAFGITL
jgi:hypothetical protein